MVATDHILAKFADPVTGERLELHRGILREKPSMSVEHGRVSFYLAFQLGQQLDRRAYEVRVNHGRLRHEHSATYSIPDVVVIPTTLAEQARQHPSRLEIYDAPLPLVVEIWSPSTGDYDVDAKIPAYMARGDFEIWRIHPYERTLTAWRRQEDGTYATQVYHGGTIQPVALPGVTVDLDALFG
jgi:Uma2 family endonuclease